MRLIAKLTGLTFALVALAGFTASSAFAQGTHSGSVEALGQTCDWENGTYTGGPPPTMLTVDGSSVDADCSAPGVDATVDNDPEFTFNDSAGTANADQIDVTVSAVFPPLTCHYSTSSVPFNATSLTNRQYEATVAGLNPGPGSSNDCPTDVTATITIDLD